MADKLSDFQLVNNLFPQTPPNWDKRISTESKEFFDNTKYLMAADAFHPIRNEIFSALVNRIGTVMINRQNFNNPLSMFKKGEMPFGDTEQEIASDVISARKFEGSRTDYVPDQFEKNYPKVEASYSRINREDFYTITVDDPRVKRAFTSQNGLSDLLNEIVSKTRKSNIVDEFIYTKKLITKYYQSENIKDGQKVQLDGDIRDIDASTTDVQSFVKTIKNIAYDVTFPNRNFTGSNMMDQIAPDNLTLIINSKAIVNNEIENLAKVFNAPQYANITFNTLPIDDFGVGGENIVALLCDNEFLRIKDTLNRSTDNYNERGLYANYFYHIHQLYAASPFKTAIYFGV